jgi:hypothetical protein
MLSDLLDSLKHTARDYTLEITVAHTTSVLNHCILETASNGGRSPSSVLPNCQRASIIATLD